MDAPSLAVLTAAPIELSIGGTTRQVNPLDLTTLGKWSEKLAAKRTAALPSMVELMQALKGHDASAVSEAIRTLYDLHREASDPSLTELIYWITSSPIVIAELIADCVVGEVDRPAVYRAILANDGFISRWMESSALGGNPTRPPSEPVAAEQAS